MKFTDMNTISFFSHHQPKSLQPYRGPCELLHKWLHRRLVRDFVLGLEAVSSDKSSVTDISHESHHHSHTQGPTLVPVQHFRPKVSLFLSFLGIAIKWKCSLSPSYQCIAVDLTMVKRQCHGDEMIKLFTWGTGRIGVDSLT